MSLSESVGGKRIRLEKIELNLRDLGDSSYTKIYTTNDIFHLQEWDNDSTGKITTRGDRVLVCKSFFKVHLKTY